MCTVREVEAGSDCIASALAENGGTVVVFDITNNAFSMASENASGELVVMRSIQPTDIAKILHGYEI